MPLVCSSVTSLQPVPGTGVSVPAGDDSWDASAVSVVSVPVAGRWTYSFDPIPGSAFITGLYDRPNFTVPRPGAYLLAIEYELDKFRVKFNDTWSGYSSHSDQRIHIVSKGGGRYVVLRGSTEVWQS